MQANLAFLHTKPMCRNVLEIDGVSGEITVVNKIEDSDDHYQDFWPSTART